MSAILLDTVGILAVLNLRDPYRGVVMPVWERFTEKGDDLFVTEPIMFEVANSLSRAPYQLRKEVAMFRRGMETEGRLISPSENLIEHCWQLYEVGHSGGPGIVDLISFEVMKGIGTRRAFTNDRHFRENGFETLF